MIDDGDYGTVIDFDGFNSKEPILKINDSDAEYEYKLRFTEALSADVEAVFSEVGFGVACKHDTTEIRRRVSKSGSLLVGYQCLVCGRISGKFLNKKERPDTELPPWDDDLEANVYRERDEKLRRLKLEIYQKHYTAQRADDDKRRKEYNEYLNSEEWKAKRGLVLKRDNYMCTGCGMARATQVHHLTYAHIYNEFLFELTSLCDECHDRVHSD